MTRSHLWTGLIFSLCIVSGRAQDQGRSSRDWLTWGGDAQRTGWAKSESILSKDNVSKLEIKWTAKLATIPKFWVLSTLTAPLVVEGVATPQGLKDLVFVVGGLTLRESLALGCSSEGHTP